MTANAKIYFTEDKTVFDYAAWECIWATTFDEPPSNNTTAPLWLAKNLPDGSHGIFALSDEEVVGFISVFTDDVLHAWVADIAVHTDHQRNGIGTALLHRANEKFSHLSMQMHAVQAPAHALCRKTGFVEAEDLVPCARKGTKKDKWQADALGKRGLRLHQDLSVVDKDALQGLLHGSGYPDQAAVIDNADGLAKFSGSLASNFLVLDADEPVAFARVISNRSNAAWLSEMCVHKNRRGHGIGKALLNDVNRAFSSQAFYLAAPLSIAPFFEGQGLTSKSNWVKVFQRGPAVG